MTDVPVTEAKEPDQRSLIPARRRCALQLLPVNSFVPSAAVAQLSRRRRHRVPLCTCMLEVDPNAKRQEQLSACTKNLAPTTAAVGERSRQNTPPSGCTGVPGQNAVGILKPRAPARSVLVFSMGSHAGGRDSFLECWFASTREGRV